MQKRVRGSNPYGPLRPSRFSRPLSTPAMRPSICPQQDSNLHSPKGTSPSSWRVCHSAMRTAGKSVSTWASVCHTLPSTEYPPGDSNPHTRRLWFLRPARLPFRQVGISRRGLTWFACDHRASLAGRIRTCGPVIPNHVRYRTAPQLDGGPGRIRTSDAGLFRPPLYRLSYRPVVPQLSISGVEASRVELESG